MGRNFTEVGRGRRLLRCALAVLACLTGGAIGAPASAQETTSSQAKAAVVQPLSLAKTADMDFGQIAGTGAGTVVMTASATPTCTVTGAIVKYGLCQPAVFEGFGQNGRTVRVKVPGAGGITITGPGGATMKITAVTTSGGTTLGPPLTGNATSNGFRRYRITAADGAFELRMAGTLNVAAGQARGLYTGTFDVEIAYE